MITTAKTCILLIPVLIIISCNHKSKSVINEETEVTRSIKNSIGWALEKDTTLLYSIISNDTDLLIINPDSSQIEGFEAFKQVTNSVWMNPKFKATHYEVKDLKITFSRNGDMAWFYCLLDDFGEWDGKKTGWENVRWTGVLEKVSGIWIFRQMHFSFPN